MASRELELGQQVVTPPPAPLIAKKQEELLDLQIKEVQARLARTDIVGRKDLLELEEAERREQKRKTDHEQFMRFREAAVRSANEETARELRGQLACPHRNDRGGTLFGVQAMTPQPDGKTNYMMTCSRCHVQHFGTVRELQDARPGLIPNQEKWGGVSMFTTED